MSNVSKPGEGLARIYEIRALDSLIEVVNAVARDAVERPTQYRDLSDEVGALLDDFRARLGKDPDWPDLGERDLVQSHVLEVLSGPAGRSLQKEAVALARAGEGDGSTALRTAFLESADLLRASLERRQGPNLDRCGRRLSQLFDRAMVVLTAAEIADVFGSPRVSQGVWPDAGAYGPDMAILVEEICRSLPEDLIPTPIPNTTLSVLQRIAHHGSNTVSRVLGLSAKDHDSGESVELLQAAYGWARALEDLSSEVDVVSAWRDRTYRESLLGIERDALPAHPSGSLDLAGAGTAKPLIILDTFGCDTAGCNTTKPGPDCEPTRTPPGNPCQGPFTTVDCITSTDGVNNCCSTGDYSCGIIA